ncbi:MAG: S1 RNA-binding domain-containing protein [Clostridia bacterium]|nr:S1 RNA-binding domain-containing protein [Clostridia bacterium]
MQVEVGVIVEGKITGLTKFGAFVELPGGDTGMVHISEVASTYVKEITDFLSEGQTVKVKVIGISDDGKISLSIKKAQEPVERPQRSNSSYSHSSGGGGGNRGRQSSNANVWQGQKNQANKSMSFEDMMQKFKQVSDEKMTDLKHINESKNGGGFSRKSGGSNKQK